MNTKKVLLLGSQGMLGTEIFNLSLESENIEIIPLSRFHADYKKPEDVQAMIEKFSEEFTLDAVVNTSAYTIVDACEDEKNHETVSLVNAISPGVIAEVCSKKGIPFYHFSTDYVFNGDTNQKFTEDSEPNPCNAYGQSKLAGEKNVLKFPNTKILRTAWLAGDNGVNFVHKMVHLSKNVENISIVTNEEGSPTFAKDVAEALFDLILTPEKYPENIYHLVSEGSATRKDLLVEIQNFLGLKTKIIDVKQGFFELAANRPYSSILKNTRFKKLPEWKDALHVFLAHEKEKQDKKRVLDAKKERAKELYRKKQAEERAALEKV